MAVESRIFCASMSARCSSRCAEGTLALPGLGDLGPGSTRDIERNRHGLLLWAAGLHFGLHVRRDRLAAPALLERAHFFAPFLTTTIGLPVLRASIAAAFSPAGL